jgi:hypothetical protein
VRVLSAWGSDCFSVEDLDDDGAITAGDILVILTAWGPC